MFRLTILALLLGAAAPSCAARKTSFKVQGQLVYVHLHNAGQEQWAIVTKNGKLQPLAPNLKPTQDRKGRALEPGSIITLDCMLDSMGACTSAMPADFTLLQKKTEAALAAAVGPVTQRILAMILDFSQCNGPAPSLNVSSVRSIYLGNAQDGSGGVAQKFSQCSYGSFNISVTGFKAISIAPKCSSNVVKYCNFVKIANLADSDAQALMGASAFDSFTHYVFIMPPGLESTCKWAGLALLPGQKIWLQTSSFGIHRWATVMQEAIHNYGLWHSWQDGLEYNDYSTAMGYGNACPNAPEIARMGWATPAIGGGALNSTSLPAGQARSFILPATYLTGKGNYLRVLPNWLPTYSDASQGKNLYIAVRVAKAGDELLQARYAGQINIHEATAVLDDAFPNSYLDPRISFVQAIPALTREVLSSYRLVVYGGSWVGIDTLAVHICRYDVDDTECPALDKFNYAPPSTSRPPTSPPSPLKALLPPPPKPTNPPPRSSPSPPKSRSPGVPNPPSPRPPRKSPLRKQRPPLPEP